MIFYGNNQICKKPIRPKHNVELCWSVGVFIHIFLFIAGLANVLLCSGRKYSTLCHRGYRLLGLGYPQLRDYRTHVFGGQVRQLGANYFP